MPDSLFVEFPPVSDEEWEAAVRLDLKGKDPASLGKILYRAGDAPSREPPQPWPAEQWQIWAEVSDLDGAKRAIAHGAQGLVVADPQAAWLSGLDAIPVFVEQLALPGEVSITRQLREAMILPADGDLVVPVGPLYFEEIAKFRALRRMRPNGRLVARTSGWHMTAYDPHVNLLRATTEAMAAIIGGCDALIVGPFTAARGIVDELAGRLALNTQLVLRDESYFGQVADPAAGSWYIESLTADLMRRARAGDWDQAATVFVGANRYPNPNESTPDSITPNRAMTALEQCRMRSERASRRPTVLLVRGSDERMSRARAAFAREFFACGGFAIVDAGDGDLAVLCDADENYPALARATTLKCPILIAGPRLAIDGISGFINRKSDQAATIAEWQQRLGI